MKNLSIVKKGLATGMAGLLLTACFPEGEGSVASVKSDGDSTSASTYGIKLPADVKQNCVVSSATFNNDWTKLSIPVNNFPEVGPVYDPSSGLVYVFPANGPAFMPNKENVDCSFFKWGAQTFNWLTSSISDVGEQNKAFPGADTPYVFNSEFFYRVIPNPDADRKGKYSLALTAQGAGTQHMMAVRSLKQDDQNLADDIDQAGGGGVLLSMNYNPNSANLEENFNQSLVYYSMHVNRTYGYFSNQKSGLSAVNFPMDSKETCETLYTAQKRQFIGTGPLPEFLLNAYCNNSEVSPTPENIVQKDGAAVGITIPELEPAVDYLAMAIELKTSWVDLSTIPADRQHRFIIQNGIVPHYVQDGKGWKQSGTKSKKLAMVGMHVVGTVNGHPEMVWATYEHVDNAPNDVYEYLTSEGKTASTSDLAPGPNLNAWLFSDAYTQPYNQETACLKDGRIMPYEGEDGGFSCKTSGGTVRTISAPNVVRTSPWGNLSGNANSQSGITDNTSLISLNRSVKKAISDNNQDDPRQYYFQAGAVWGDNGQIPLFSNLNTSLAGTEWLSNTTMETFHQATATNNSLNNFGCFSCHAATTVTIDQSAPEKSLKVINGVSVSHIFSDIDPNIPK